MSIKRICAISMLGAILFLMQILLAPIPNVELVSLLILLYTLVFGRDAFWTILVFNLLEGVVWGMGSWWFSYLYVWPLLYFACFHLKRFFKEDFLLWAVVLGLYGLVFGSLFALVYIPIDRTYALTYWISGLPWDLWHAIANFVLTLVLGKPLYRAIKHMVKYVE